MQKRALILGLTGQDGSYLSELLLGKGYEVHGVIRRSSVNNLERIRHLQGNIPLWRGDLSDFSSLRRIVSEVRPDEVYNLAAMSDVGISFEVPEYTADVTGSGAIRVLEAIRQSGCPARYYQASSSEMFGSAPPPQSEATPFHPRSPYGCAKVFAYYATINYREAYKMHASNGILFNHESPRRGENFVTRKIVKAAVRIAKKQQESLSLGNLDAKRDWGYAGDFVEAMWLMLQQSAPDDYVVATGETHSVREFVDITFRKLGLDWGKYVRIDPTLFRPAEVDALLGDPAKARAKLGWIPKVGFEQLIEKMIDAEL